MLSDVPAGATPRVPPAVTLARDPAYAAAAARPGRFAQVSTGCHGGPGRGLWRSRHGRARTVPASSAHHPSRPRGEPVHDHVAPPHPRLRLPYDDRYLDEPGPRRPGPRRAPQLGPRLGRGTGGRPAHRAGLPRRPPGLALHRSGGRQRRGPSTPPGCDREQQQPPPPAADPGVAGRARLARRPGRRARRALAALDGEPLGDAPDLPEDYARRHRPAAGRVGGRAARRRGPDAASTPRSPPRCAPHCSRCGASTPASVTGAASAAASAAAASPGRWPRPTG